MKSNRKRLPILLFALLMLIACIPAMASADPADVQEITVPNTPVKGVIELEKRGPVLKGFYKTQDAFGYTLHTPIYGTGWLEGAVFEVRAVEDIVGKDGTLWFKADELADTIVTVAGTATTSKELPLGHYYVTEVSAPAGYVFDSVRYDVILAAKDHETPLVRVRVKADNDYMHTRITLVKEKEVLSTTATKAGSVHTDLVNVPGEGFVFGLYNAGPIPYPTGTLASDTLIATAVSDKNGELTFYGRFPQGQYYAMELTGPEGWQIDSTRHMIHISDDAVTANHELLISLDEPIVNRLIHTDVRISKTDLTGSDYLPHTMIEVRNADGETVLKDYTGEDGYLPAFPAEPGEYTYREVLAPEGFEICTTELCFTVNADGTVEGKTAVADDYTRFSILKVDTQQEPLAGVEFGLFREDGALQATAVSDSDGLVTFERIPYGTYTIQETQPLPGYLKNTTKIPVTVDGTFVNPTEPIAVLENCETEILIRKVDQDAAPLAGAVFALRDANEKTVMTAVSDPDGLVRFIGVSCGKYTIREVLAPEGYLMNHDVISITVDEGYTNSETPAATVMDPLKKIMCIKADPSGKPLPGVEFSLYNAATMELAETAVSDENGVFTFTKFDYGDWIIRETAAPEGYSRMEDIRFHVGDGWTAPEPILCVNIPDHYEFVKTDSSGNPLVGVKFRLEGEDGNELGIYESGEDGIVRMTGLAPGVYVIREIETLKGYTLSGDVIKLTLDSCYVVPETVKQFINYTTIQTGVHLAVTIVMWIGLGLMAVSGTLGIIRKRKQRRVNKQGASAK